MLTIYEFLTENGQEYCILFLFPLVGYLLGRFFSEKIYAFLIVACLVFLIPVFTKFQYSIPYIKQSLITLMSAAAYAYYSHSKKNTRTQPIIGIAFSMLLFLGVGFLHFVNGMSGAQTIEQHWTFQNYKVEKIRYTAFSGHPVSDYKLYRYTSVPVFVRYLERVRDNDTLPPCIIRFEAYEINLNRCDGRIY